MNSRYEYRRIIKRLEWHLFDRPPFMVSILDRDEELEGDEPEYLAKKSTESHPDFSGWLSVRFLRRQLRAEPLAAAEAAGVPGLTERLTKH